MDHNRSHETTRIMARVDLTARRSDDVPLGLDDLPDAARTDTAVRDALVAVIGLLRNRAVVTALQLVGVDQWRRTVLDKAVVALASHVG